MFLIEDETGSDELFPKNVCTGLVPRDFENMPLRAVTDLPEIPESEWDARIKEQEEKKSRLSDIRMTGNFGAMIPSLDQNLGDGVHWGYCWAHSGVHGNMLIRARDGMPYVPLSAFAVAATIKNGRNDGGWGAQGLEFMMTRGVPDQKYWPQKNVKLSNGTPECWENAAKHKITAGWMDVAAPLWGRKLSFKQVATCLLLRIPVILDYNWWGHSVVGMDLVRVEAGSYGIRIWNSWADSWGEKGTGVLRGNRAVPDNATAPRISLAA